MGVSSRAQKNSLLFLKEFLSKQAWQHVVEPPVREEYIVRGTELSLGLVRLEVCLQLGYGNHFGNALDFLCLQKHLDRRLIVLCEQTELALSLGVEGVGEGTGGGRGGGWVRRRELVNGLHALRSDCTIRDLLECDYQRDDGCVFHQFRFLLAL